MNEPLRDLDDDQLVSVVQRDPGGERGRRAASQLLGRWRGRVYLWCFRYVRDHELALDMSQECMLQAYTALPRFEARARFSSWLFAIVRNRCFTALRPRILARDEDVDLEQMVSAARGPEDDAEHRDQQARVVAMMVRVLDAREQEAVWLRAIEDMPVDDITRVMKLDGTSGARGLLQTARRKLRAALAEQDDSQGRAE